MLKKSLLGIVIAALLTAAPASAEVVQTKKLTATGTAKTWTSPKLPPGTFAFIYDGGQELTQVHYGSCLADYVGRGIIVQLRVKECRNPRSSVYELRYVSVDGPQRLTVKLVR